MTRSTDPVSSGCSASTAQFPIVGATDVLGDLGEGVARPRRPDRHSVVGGTPDVQSAVSSSGERFRSTSTSASSWLTCRVPFKKTDLFTGGVAAVALPGSTTSPTSRKSRAPVSTGCDNVLFPGGALRQRRGAGRLHLLLDDVAATAPAGSNSVIRTLAQRHTPVDTTGCGGWHDLSLQTAPTSSGVLEVWPTTVGGCSRSSGSSPGAVPVAQLHRRETQSRLWCRIMADVLDRPIRQVKHPIRASAVRPAAHSGSAGATALTDVAQRRVIRTSIRPGQPRSTTALPRIPGDLQADEEHLRPAAPWLTATASTPRRCASGATPGRAS
jgi:xylulokinase